MKAITKPRKVIARLLSDESDLIMIPEKNIRRISAKSFLIVSFGNWKRATIGEDMLVDDGKCIYPCKKDVFNETYTQIDEYLYAKNIYVIDFIRCEKSIKAIRRFVGKDRFNITCGVVTIDTLEGWVTVAPGEYIIRSVKGEVYPVDAETFEKIYSICQ